MPFTPETISVKSYNQCIKCDYLGAKCDGPNLISLQKERFFEWCRLRKEYLGWTNAKLAEVSGVSKATVDRINSSSGPGLNGDTMSAIACALIYQKQCADGGWGRFPCPLSENLDSSDTEQLKNEVAMLKLQLEQQQKNDREKIDYLKQQVSFKDSQMLAKDRHLSERKEFLRQKDKTIETLEESLRLHERTAKRLGAALLCLAVACVLFIAMYLIPDIIDGSWGAFRY